MKDAEALAGVSEKRNGPPTEKCRDPFPTIGAGKRRMLSHLPGAGAQRLSGPDIADNGRQKRAMVRETNQASPISIADPRPDEAMTKDEIYRAHNDPAAPFEFSEQVVKVFPDMIERSVPGYRLLLELTPILVRRAVRPETRIFDLGCSLGAATLAARRAVHEPGVSITAIDNAPDMVARCRTLIEEDNSRVPVDVIEGDIRHVEIDNASVVLVYFTLQFLPLEARDELLKTIAQGMVPGGVLILAEKIAFERESAQSWMDEHHHDFKRAQGYSDLEIARKRQALENVLVPESRRAHHDRLKRAGFSEVHDWFQCFNFSCMAAVR